MNPITKIKNISSKFEGTLGITVKNLVKGEIFTINGDLLFPTASVFKVPLIVEMYRQVEKVIINLDEKVKIKYCDKVPGSGILKELTPGFGISIH